MALVTTKEMFEKALKADYAVGAFNVNNMEIIMNISPVKIILLLLLLSNDSRNSQPAYFDTFRLDLLLDRLHHTVNALENVNRLRQFNLDTLSLPEAKPAPPQESAPDMSKMMESFGPMLNMLMNQK